jgi:hypothetical protein
MLQDVYSRLDLRRQIYVHNTSNQVIYGADRIIETTDRTPSV